jgi:hypothetical protein
MRGLFLASALVATTTLATATLAQADQPHTLRSLWSAQLLRQPALDKQIAGARDLGLKHVRIAVRWSEVEKVRGVYNWTTTDKRLRPILAAGMAPLITLMGPNPLYDRTDGKTVAASSSEESVAGFAKFAAAVAERYHGDGFRYEIWNEPNLRTFWKPNPDGRLYADLATASCKAIKEVQPQAQVFVLGMNGTPVDRDYMGHYVTWSRAALVPEMVECAAGISVHPYGRKLPESYLADLPKIRALLEPVVPDGAKKQIMISEWGTPIAAKWQLDAAAQVNRDLRILLVGALAGQYTNLFTMMAPGSNMADSEQTFGLLDYSGTPKPSYAMVKTLLARVGDDELEPVCAPCDGNLYSLRFRSGQDGKTVAYIAWTSHDTVQMPAPKELGDKPQLINLDTNEARPLPAEPLKITSDPVLLISASRS